MRILIAAIGRRRGGPEHALIDDYVQRFERAGRPLGLGPVTVTALEDKKRVGESRILLETIPDGAFVVALDERGKTLDSRGFADRLARVRDDGVQDIAFLIGGADGHDQTVRDRADLSLSFGAMVWPHMLVRVMLTEQLYRAASILAGAPYHRD